jgi:serine/tyrosine/threonine adenylyltransferase
MHFSPDQQTFAQLGSSFYTALSPQPLPKPYWVGRSRAMAQSLGLGDAWLQSDETLQALTGNALLPGSQPLASVYSGHQFGHWAGQLGDGRALLLGETRDAQGQPQEIQLKGAGRTPYSRMGDGRAVLRSSIREFLCSEAMHGLGIPTTRALAVTGSDAPIRREEIETAAVVTRVAPSFIRFGHFEHFAFNAMTDELRQLADCVISRFYPDCKDANNPYAALLEAVSSRTAKMVAQWQAVGFCHGVMNTDNMSILGLTIDYGPFQFLDAFDPNHICNHSDDRGRYAYNKQPNVAYWNLFCLGQALMPLISPGGEPDLAVAALEPYKTLFPQALHAQMCAKLGMQAAALDAAATERSKALIESLLKLLAANKVDFTIFWRRLSHAAASGEYQTVRDVVLDREAFDAWLLSFNEHSVQHSCRPDADLMLKTNPAYVLRNHLGEQAIRGAKQKDFSELERLQSLLQDPFTEVKGMEAYATFPPDWASTIEISCSS